MRALVTGGAGFIGSRLADALLDRGWGVLVADNLSAGSRDKVNPKARFLKGDLLDKDFCLKASMGYDFIFHFAAKSAIRGETEEESKKQILDATVNMVEAAKANGVKNFVFPSTAAVYGNPKTLPSGEGSKTAPVSFYAENKLKCEKVLERFSRTGANVWIFRVANVVGPRMTHGVLYDFWQKLRKNPKRLEILGDGMQSKSYIHATDCIEGMLLAIEKTKGFNIFNLASRDRITVRGIARILSKEMGLKPELVYTGGKTGWRGDVPQMLLDISKLESLGWRPRHNSREAVELAARWFANE